MEKILPSTLQQRLLITNKDISKTFDVYYIILLLFVYAQQTQYNKIVIDFILLENHLMNINNIIKLH